MKDRRGGEILIDVTRLIWRRWRGGLPTGIDRVCLAYLEHFGPRARAVIQRKGFFVTLSVRRSQQLFRILLDTDGPVRPQLALFALKAWTEPFRGAPPSGALYLNVGHTGLDEPSLPRWIARNRLKAVFLIHDLIPITHPHFCRPGEDKKHERRMRNVLTSASGIIGNSQATVEELRRFAHRLGLPMPPSTAAWLSGNALQQGHGEAKADRPYFLVLGTIEGRKNHELLLEVWRRLVLRLGDQSPKLIIVGGRGWQADAVFRQLDAPGPLQGHIEELPRCSDKDLARLMAGARALLMPSHAEGYGLPVFEALELGTPVIATDLPVYREIAGNIPTYLGARDVGGWERAVIDYLGDDPQRSGQLDRLSGFKVPDWEGHFATVEHWLHALVD